LFRGYATFGKFRKGDIMRSLMLLVLAVASAGVVMLADTAPASARDYPWCLQGRGVGRPGDCSFRTFAQCRASASGRNATCNVNPRVAFARQRAGLPPLRH
jgi:hypothetical protein